MLIVLVGHVLKDGLVGEVVTWLYDDIFNDFQMRLKFQSSLGAIWCHIWQAQYAVTSCYFVF